MMPKEIDFNSRVRTILLKFLIILGIILAGELKSCSAVTHTDKIKRESGGFKKSTPFHRHKRKQQQAFSKTCVPRQKLKRKPAAGYNHYR